MSGEPVGPWPAAEMLFTYNPYVRRLARQALGIACRGDGCECPCCERSFRRFIPRHGVDLMCPGCLAMQRHRLLILYLLEQTPLASQRLSVLDVAPQEGLQERLTRLMADGYVSLDAHPGSIAGQTGDVTTLPFGDEQFDLVLCSHVLEHVVDDELALEEFMRVLRPGGTALLMQPVHDELALTVEDSRITEPRDRQIAFGQADHVRIYGRDFIDRVTSAGFGVERIDYLESLVPSEIDRYSLGHEDIYVARKPPCSSA